MRVYADTSVLVAWHHPADIFAALVTPWLQECGPEFCWNAILRAELRHNLRLLQGPYSRTDWNAYSAAENTRRLVSSRERLTDLFQQADELSERFASRTSCGTWDVVHVAAAMRANAEAFATCDEAQARLARLSGLTEVKLFVV
jgi:predicted nucleic acid-binding protein